MNPVRTVGLLRVLQRAGFNDDAFHIVHHFSESESIESHIKYCLIRTKFQPNGNNEIVQKRLEYVLDKFLNLGETVTSAVVFAKLAHESAVTYPN